MKKESPDQFDLERIKKVMWSRTDKQQSKRMIREMMTYIPLRKISAITGVSFKTLNTVLYTDTATLKMRHAIVIKALYDGLFSTLKTVDKKKKYLSKFK